MNLPIKGKQSHRSVFNILFVLVLVFSNTLCFAGEKEELERLTAITTILSEVVPVVPTKIIHDLMIKAAVERGKAFDLVEADQFTKWSVRTMKAKGVDWSKCQSNIVNQYIDNFKKNPENVEALAQVFVEPLVGTLRLPLNNRMAKCQQLAVYAFNIIVFDLMNDMAEKKKPLFTTVSFMATLPGTGDHLATVVRGSSGIVYLVDPWANKVVIIKDFSKKSGWMSEVWQTSLDVTKPALSLKENLNPTIAKEYEDQGFYDMVFVSSTTKWELLMSLSNNMRQLVQSHNSKIGPLYAELKPYFTWWQLPYDSLFGITATKEKKEKEKE